MGISTLYQHFASPLARFISIEGNKAIYDCASENISNIIDDAGPDLIHGLFENCLPSVLEGLERLDYLFIDGDHRYEAVLKNYHQIRPLLHDHSIVVIHDIYWSSGMSKAWFELTKLEEVRFSIDLFYMGILFFRPFNDQPVHVTLIRSICKPWRLGIFSTNSL